MPKYRIECSRIRETREVCIVDIEAPDEEAAYVKAEQMAEDGNLNFLDDDGDLPEWRDADFAIVQDRDEDEP